MDLELKDIPVEKFDALQKEIIIAIYKMELKVSDTTIIEDLNENFIGFEFEISTL